MWLYLSYSEAGGHRVNEDAFAILPHPENPEYLVCALADGQGGRAGGAAAARLACDTAIQRATHYPCRSVLDAATWTSVLHQADDAVRDDPHAGFCTLIGLALRDRRIIGCSSGDSAVWLVDATGGMIDLTHAQHKNPPVGSGGAVFVPFACDAPDRATLLVMSDGVWKYLDREKIVKLAGSPDGAQVIETLQHDARLPGSGKFQDDFTLLLFRRPA